MAHGDGTMGKRSSRKHMCVRVSSQRAVPRTKAGSEPGGHLIPIEEGESEKWTQRGRVKEVDGGWKRELERRMERETEYSCEALESCAAIAASPHKVKRSTGATV